jgi:hypothetical protein
LSKVKFNGESNSFAFHHVHQFILNCKKFDIDDGVMCRIFTLTLTGQAKDWCRSFPVASIDSWDEFARMFLQTFQDYDCNQVFQELENLCKIEGESYEYFLLRFKLIFFQFQSDDFPSHLN